MLEADAFTTMLSGILGTSSTVTYIESAAGIANGARTGLSSVFTALFFLLRCFCAYHWDCARLCHGTRFDFGRNLHGETFGENRF